MHKTPSRTMFALLLIILIALLVGFLSDKSWSNLSSAPTQRPALETQRIEELILLPASVVEFLSLVYPFAGTSWPSVTDVCTEVNINFLNERQETPEKFEQHLLSHYELELDGQVLPRSITRFRKRGTGVVDNKGNPVASGILIACSRVTLAEGPHLATVRVKSLEGKVYSYTWAFRIDPHTSEREATKQAVNTDPYVQQDATIAARYLKATASPTQ